MIAGRRSFLRGLGAALVAPAIVPYANLMPVKSFIDWRVGLAVGREANEGFSGWFAAQYGRPSAEDFMDYLVSNDLPRFEYATVPVDHPEAKRFMAAQATMHKESRDRLIAQGYGHYAGDPPKPLPPHITKVHVTREVGTPKPDLLPKVIVPRRDEFGGVVRQMQVDELIQSDHPGFEPVVSKVEARKRAMAVFSKVRRVPVEALPKVPDEAALRAQDRALIASGRLNYWFDPKTQRRLTQADYSDEHGIYELWRDAHNADVKRRAKEQDGEKGALACGVIVSH